MFQKHTFWYYPDISFSSTWETSKEIHTNFKLYSKERQSIESKIWVSRERLMLHDIAGNGIDWTCFCHVALACIFYWWTFSWFLRTAIIMHHRRSVTKTTKDQTGTGAGKQFKLVVLTQDKHGNITAVSQRIEFTSFLLLLYISHGVLYMVSYSTALRGPHMWIILNSMAFFFFTPQQHNWGWCMTWQISVH